MHGILIPLLETNSTLRSRSINLNQFKIGLNPEANHWKLNDDSVTDKMYLKIIHLYRDIGRIGKEQVWEK